MSSGSLKACRVSLATEQASIKGRSALHPGHGFIKPWVSLPPYLLSCSLRTETKIPAVPAFKNQSSRPGMPCAHTVQKHGGAQGPALIPTCTGEQV